MNNKIRFFGSNIGAKVKYRIAHEDFLKLLDIDTFVYLNARHFSDCQIIGRRISQMTDEEKLTMIGNEKKGWNINPNCNIDLEHMVIEFEYQTMNYINNIGDFDIINDVGSVLITIDKLDYLNSIHVYPDKYFEPQNNETLAWVTEEKK